MSLLAAVHYDPAVAVSKSCAAALAMTAFDTTNLRLGFTIPASGKVYAKIGCAIHGGAGFPQILLGILQGSTIITRRAAFGGLYGTAAATTILAVQAEFTLGGLTPGAVNWDAAYDVETLMASSAVKYGGPNDATANNAFGGISFEVWGLD